LNRNNSLNNDYIENQDSQLELQLSKSSFTIENGKSDSLNIKAFLLDSKEIMTYSSDAEIQIISDANGMEINPSHGKGIISSTLFVSEVVIDGEYYIKVTSELGNKRVIKYATIRIISK